MALFCVWKELLKIKICILTFLVWFVFIVFLAHKEFTDGTGIHRVKDEDDDSEDEDNELEGGADDEISKLKLKDFNGYRKEEDNESKVERNRVKIRRVRIMMKMKRGEDNE